MSVNRCNQGEMISVTTSFERTHQCGQLCGWGRKDSETRVDIGSDHGSVRKRSQDAIPVILLGLKDSVNALDSPEGGLMIYAAFCDNATPLENIEATCEAFEEYCLKGKPA